MLAVHLKQCLTRYGQKYVNVGSDGSRVVSINSCQRRDPPSDVSPQWPSDAVHGLSHKRGQIYHPGTTTSGYGASRTQNWRLLVTLGLDNRLKQLADAFGEKCLGRGLRRFGQIGQRVRDLQWIKLVGQHNLAHNRIGLIR